MTLLFKKPLLYILLFFLLSFIVRLFYTAVSYILPFDPYIDVALANSFLALFTLKGLSFKKEVNLSKGIIPAIIIIVGSFVVSKLSYIVSPYPNNSSFDYKPILIACLWIPIVEELVYRRLFSKFLVDKNYILWSCYLSALFFSINHSLLNMTDFPINMISLPVGPFLLGAICQLLVLYSGSIISAVSFHIACNLTVFIFLYNDNRWLDWLSYLYLSGN